MMLDAYGWGGNKMKTFGNYHPLVLMIYFISVVVVAMFVWNPVLQLIAILAGIAFCVVLQRKREILGDVVFYIPLFIMVSITNPLFSHNGVTPLFFLNGNPVTLEAFIYGIFIGVMIIGVMFWCKAYSIIMTSDKFLYLFGKGIPKLSLVLSMALRFIPMFKKQMRKVSKAQKTMGLYSSKSYVDKVQSGMRVFSALITWSLENAMETSSSMKARGYGLKGRSNFSLFHFTLKDSVLLGTSITLISITLLGIGLGKMDFSFYPRISKINSSFLAIITYITYGVLTFLPFIIEIKENIKWKYYISKI